MRPRCTGACVFLLAAAPLAVAAATSPPDWRAIEAGHVILSDSYVGQPYVTRWHNASVSERWVVGVTRNTNPSEGSTGTRVETLFSDDLGVSWSVPVVVDGRALTSAYSALFTQDGGAGARVGVIYGINSANVSTLPNGSPLPRADMLGTFALKFSSDGGASWPGAACEVPVRATAIDASNVPWGGSVQMQWNVDTVKPWGAQGVAFAFTKIGSYPLSPPEELFVLASPNARVAARCEDVQWAMLPDGAHGIAPPGGNPGVGEEGHAVALASGGVFIVMRTAQGVLGAAATRDASAAGGWGPAGAARVWNASGAGAGAAVKNGRSPITLKRLANGRYLLLSFFTAGGGRNPYWLSCGVEEGGEVRFSQPELALYAPPRAPYGLGYPDIIELDDGRVFITESNKSVARAHAVDARALALLLAQDSARTLTRDALALIFNASSARRAFPTPTLPSFRSSAGAWGEGTAVSLWLANHSAAAPGDVLLDTRSGAPPTRGVALRVGPSRAIVWELTDDAGSSVGLVSDAACTAPLLAAPHSEAHLVTALADTNARVLSLAIDGVLCDGGADAPAGWTTVPPAFGTLQGGARTFTLAPSYKGEVRGGGWYERTLYTSEVVGNFRAGLAE